MIAKSLTLNLFY